VDFARTWSCYKGGEIHCGRCGTCVERREAFLVAGLPDPTIYASTDALPPKPEKPNSKSQTANPKETLKGHPPKLQ